MTTAQYDAAVTAALGLLILTPLCALGYAWRFDIELWSYFL